MSMPTDVTAGISAHAQIFHEARLWPDLVAFQSQLLSGDVLHLFQDSLLNKQPAASINWNRLWGDGSCKVSKRRTSSGKLTGPSCSHGTESNHSEREHDSRNKAAQCSKRDQEQNKRWNPQKQQEETEGVEPPSRLLGEMKLGQMGLELCERLPTRPTCGARKRDLQGRRRSQCATIDTALLTQRASKAEERTCGRAEPTRLRQSRDNQRRKVRHGANVRALRVRQLDPKPILDLHHEFNAVKTHAAMVSAGDDLGLGRSHR